MRLARRGLRRRLHASRLTDARAALIQIDRQEDARRLCLSLADRHCATAAAVHHRLRGLWLGAELSSLEDECLPCPDLRPCLGPRRALTLKDGRASSPAGPGAG